MNLWFRNPVARSLVEPRVVLPPRLCRCSPCRHLGSRLPPPPRYVYLNHQAHSEFAINTFENSSNLTLLSCLLYQSLSEEYRQGTAALADMDEMAPVPREAYKKLPSGVIIADLRPGKAEEGVVKNGSRINLQWVSSCQGEKKSWALQKPNL